MDDGFTARYEREGWVKRRQTDLSVVVFIAVMYLMLAAGVIVSGYRGLKARWSAWR